MSGSIYYIACTETMRLKIGFTLSALQTGSPTELVVVAVRPGTMSEEQALHRKFSKQRVRGEWFQMDAELFEHMFFVVLDNAADAFRKGEPLDRLTKLGLHSLEQIEPLPPVLKAMLQ